jgi:hypothetical protein
MTKQEAQAFINAFVKLRELATDEMSIQVPNLYPTWKVGVNYIKDSRVLFNETLYKILMNHTSQEDWNPEVSPSLFAKVLIPDENVIPEWEQPDSTNTYKIGDKVTHNGKVWVSTVNTNSWEPGVYGWDEVAE